MTEGLTMNTNTFSAGLAGAGIQQPDTAYAGIDEFADFLEIARHWSVRHMGGASLYSGVDQLGDPFLLILDNDGQQVEIIRRHSFDDFERTTSADGQQRKNWAGHDLPDTKLEQQQWIEQYVQQARDRVQGLRDDPATDPKHLEGAETVLKIIDPGFFAAPADSPPEVDVETYVIEEDYQHRPFIHDDEVIEDARY
jgi:hypothetical protein